MGIEQPTFKEKLKRFWMVYFKGYVRVTTISKDPDTDGYRMDTEIMLRKDVPVEAVHNSGDKHGYTIDKVKIKYPYRYDEGGFSAIDLNLWLENNDINDALALKWDGMKNIEPKHLAIIAAVAIGALVIFYVLKGGF